MVQRSDYVKSYLTFEMLPFAIGADCSKLLGTKTILKLLAPSPPVQNNSTKRSDDRHCCSDGESVTRSGERSWVETQFLELSFARSPIRSTGTWRLRGRGALFPARLPS
jgi:hypothetical protein